MGIQKCENCEMKFKYKALLKVLVGSSLECRNCRAPHETILSSKVVLSILLIWPAFIKSVILSIFPNLTMVFLVYLVYVVILAALSPYFLKYKLKDNLDKN
ncbi:MAG: hypothetical protein RBR71_13780 [Gudongella sp.]|nr:hypothetical protein [Gudongella sp.]